MYIRPTHPARSTRRLVALLMLFPLVLLGCGTADAGEGAPTPEQLAGGSLAADFDLQGAEFTVGSKEFTESVILGKITIMALQAAGATVTDQTGLAGTNIVRTALETGEVDMYWEYSGTGWSLFLQHTDTLPDEQQQFEATANEDLQQNGIRWLGPAEFGNQYAIARRSDAPEPLASVDKLSDLSGFIAANEDEATFCGAAEFLDREFLAMQDAYDAHFPPPQVYQNDFALNFVNVAKGSPCNFAEVFTTDARIKSLDLTVIEDDKNFFLTQLAALTTREEVYQEHPELGDIAMALGEKLDEDTMIELNGMVDLEGRTAEEAAARFLRDNGFIG
ncbi:glycine betaine ABC transporter substrate-binding protein [Pseudonocardia nigra]|uniref:glycine betaine ABC transporter substrate-binding protein n=1 Tax=Pseudonocardia nigra TaxID=1921578 RepID=UPI001C5F224B|nr:glycine betaine ABC transporter substrate-binding protein [Pseudonocardia nigra]